jgi:membrane protein implicated in regulation of membrane protease activity
MTAGVIAAAAPASSMVTPGILGFLVFAALAVALVFLLRSMNKQFRKITPESGPPGGEGAGAPVGGEEARDPARTPE